MACVVTKQPHKLEVISKVRFSVAGGHQVVRWCSDCGAVVIDVDVDGHVMPGQLLPMKFPALALSAAKAVPTP